MSSRRRPCRIALVQMEVHPGNPEENLARAVQRISEAAARGADLALLPECLDHGWTDGSCREGASPVPGGEASDRLAGAAREYRIHVCAGLTERAGDRIYNAAVLLDREGEILLRHRKIHELEIGRPFYEVGDRLGVVDTELGRIGLMICADGFAEGLVLSRSLGRMGAEIILSPCAWAVPADHDNAAEPYGDCTPSNPGQCAVTERRG